MKIVSRKIRTWQKKMGAGRKKCRMWGDGCQW